VSPRRHCGNSPAPGSSGPGKAILDKACAWLDGQSTEDPRARKPTPAPRLSSDAKPNGRDPSHHRAGPLRPNRLTAQQCEALRLLLSLDLRGLRQAGISSELAERAATGQAVPSEVIERLVAFLARE